MLPVPTLDYLAEFSGRALSSYGPFAEQALTQSALLFSTITGLQQYPEDPDKQQVAINGILEMADRIYLEQPHAAVRANPFNSENIGSYGYSKGFTSVIARAVRRDPTGMLWWDMAVEELSTVPRSLVQSGSIAVFDHDLRQTATGRYMIPGPADLVVPEFMAPGGSAEFVAPADAPNLPVEEQP